MQQVNIFLLCALIKNQKKKIIEYLNWGISDNYEIREKIFNGFFEVYGFILQDDDIIKK